MWLTDQNRYLSHLLISPSAEHTTSSNTQRTQSGFDCWLSGDNLLPWSIYIGHRNPDRFLSFPRGTLLFYLNTHAADPILLTFLFENSYTYIGSIQGHYKCRELFASFSRQLLMFYWTYKRSNKYGQSLLSIFDKF